MICEEDEEEGDEVDCADKKTRTPHLGCGEKLIQPPLSYDNPVTLLHDMLTSSHNMI